MEQYIDVTRGIYDVSHVKQGIIVRDKLRVFVGIVVNSKYGFIIRTYKDEFLGGELTVNSLILRFSNYQFYLL